MVIISRRTIEVMKGFQNRSHLFAMNFYSFCRGGSRIFLRGGALVSCSASTPINHIFFFCRIPVVLENRRSSQGGGMRTPCTLPLDPPLFCLLTEVKSLVTLASTCCDFISIRGRIRTQLLSKRTFVFWLKIIYFVTQNDATEVGNNFACRKNLLQAMVSNFFM